MIKRWYRKLPISYKIRLLLMIAGLAGIICFGGAYIYFGVQTTQTNITSEASRTANLFGSRNVAAIRFQSKDFTRKNLEAIRNNPAHDAICLYEANGALFAYYSRITDWLCPKIAPMQSGAFREQEYEKLDRLFIIRNIYHEGEIIGAVLVVANRNQVQEYIITQFQVMSIIALIAMALCAFLANYMQKLISQPIIDISKDVQVITGSKHFEGRIVERYEDELGQVASAFNRTLSFMEQSLHQSQEKQKETAEAYHASLKHIEELKEQFLESSESFNVYANLLNTRPFGNDTAKYTGYQLDVLESMENYNIRLESFNRLSKLYASAIAVEKVEITFPEYLDNYSKKLKRAVPFLPIRNAQQLIKAGDPFKVKVYKVALDEGFSMMRNLFETLVSIVEFSPQLNIVYDEETKVVMLNFMSTDIGSKLVSGKPQFDWLPQNAAENEHDVSTEHGFARFSIEDPQVAEEFINTEFLKRSDFRYILDSLAYILNANSIDIEHRFGKNSFNISLKLDSVLSGSNELIEEYIVQ